MRDPAAHIIRLTDYQPPAWLAPAIDLDFDIFPDHTIASARTRFVRNPVAGQPQAALALDGDGLELIDIALNGKTLANEHWQMSATQLRISDLPDTCELTIRTRLDPAANTQLMGLYASKDGLFTQCEAEGFRRITWALDRPDVMSRYRVTVHATHATHPVLLSNGNADGAGDEPGGRHWARWVDPFPKPSYLFALVAARLDVLADHYVTASGRRVELYVYVEPGKLDQCAFAMEALKKAARWDEQVFGREFDLDRYSIVAVGDFNMGAMENKGLNIFNTKYVLARPDVATDKDFENIDRVVAHEYFHNWTGNRVTCRDWFQLSLKEGLTVYRDQEVGADHYSRAVQRIQEVRTLRAAQFPEDAGPMAHPIRPDAYIQISNFYTATVYEKGAEVVRMIHTLLGASRFRAGMDVYFERHDGQAVTTEDFLAAMADGSGVDLTQFVRWYHRAGTPRVSVEEAHDPLTQTYRLRLRQSSPLTAYDQREGADSKHDKAPLHIPLALGLLDPQGNDLELRLVDEQTSAAQSRNGHASRHAPESPGQSRKSAAPGEADASNGAADRHGTPRVERTRVLSVTAADQTFVFSGIAQRPVASLLRDFSAPVILQHAQSAADLAHRMAYDVNAFARWEAGQQLASTILLNTAATDEAQQAFLHAIGRVLDDALCDPAFAAEALGLPSETTLAEQIDPVDPDRLHQTRLALRRSIAATHRSRMLEIYEQLAPVAPYSPDARSAARRALRNALLGLLMDLPGDKQVAHLCVGQFNRADNMTDASAALAMMAQTDHPDRQGLLDQFYARWAHEALVIDKWFSIQAMSRRPGTLSDVRRLLEHPAFDLRNPNKVRALISSFCHGNHQQFHAADGAGYQFCAEQVLLLDPLNPQVASRLARAFDRWRRFDAAHQANARSALTKIQNQSGLSSDLQEIITRSLG